MEKNNYIPWVEKYRPKYFSNIVLDRNNHKILSNILNINSFPNLLLYGPPGTGKTTTIINLIEKYQKSENQLNKGLMIHLNASDERGIDIIRNQINSFVSSKTFFKEGIKFVILDEVDYMTKNAQVALKYLIQEYNNNVRFILICNYISKVDNTLQNEFVKLTFSNQPVNDIISFLQNINNSEELNLTDDEIKSIQENFKSDIRSMINFMQTNQSCVNGLKIITHDIFDKISDLLIEKDYNKFVNFIDLITINYNIDIKNLIKSYINYFIRLESSDVNENLIDIIECILHNLDINSLYLKNYFFYSFSKLYV
tara:strand:+ start:8837 stop:9772 length:936 start_codon:yes stop_codon:yes gene_type:complete